MLGQRTDRDGIPCRGARRSHFVGDPYHKGWFSGLTCRNGDRNDPRVDDPLHGPNQRADQQQPDGVPAPQPVELDVQQLDVLERR